MNWTARRSELNALLGILHGSRALGGPVQAMVELTNRCNVRCTHCYYHSPLIANPNTFELRLARMRGGGGGESLADFRKREADGEALRETVESFLSMGTRRFIFTGSGEPFMHKSALELMALAARAGSHCVVNTNGTLLDRSTLDALTDMRFGELRVTTMAGSAEVWVRTHPGSGKAHFEALAGNLECLAERKRSAGLKHPAVTLILVITAQNIGSLREFTDFAVETGADEVIFRPFNDVDDEGFSELLPSPEQHAEASETLAFCGPRLEKAGIRHNALDLYNVLYRKLETAAFYRVVPCYYGWLSMRVNVAGNVYPCCGCHRSLGNVRESGVAPIWFGEEYRRFRARALTLNRRGGSVEDCVCEHCVHFGANLRVFRILHPLAARRERLNRLIGSARSAGGEG